MRKILFALIAMAAACADNSSPGDDNGGGGGGGGTGSGSDDGDGDGSGDGSGGTTTADRMQDYGDVAAALGQNLAIGEIGMFADSVNFAYGRAPEGFIASQGSDYVVFDGQRAGLTIRYKVFCRDAADLYAPCDGLEDHAHVKPTYSGTISGAAASMSDISRSGSWIVRDMTLANVRLGGEGTDSFAARFSTGEYSFVVTDTLNHLLYAPGAALPNAGKVELVVNVARSRVTANPPQRTFDVAAVIELEGGDAARITLDTSEIFRLSLTTGAVTRI